MEYLRKFHGELILVSAEDRLRTKLAVERKKPNPDNAIIEKIAEDIANAQAVRLEYQKLQKLEKELPEYISML